MRIIGAGLVLGRLIPLALLTLWPNMGAAATKAKPAEAKPSAAQPQQPKTAAQPQQPAQPKPPAAGTPRAVYAAMPEHERMMIQADLIWTGFYNGIIDSDFGDNSVAAVKAFQKYAGGRETGLLNPDERAKLSEAARARREKAGWRVVDDRATGVRVGIPGKLAPQSAPSGSGTRWQSSRGEIQVETFRINAPGTMRNWQSSTAARSVTIWPVLLTTIPVAYSTSRRGVGALATGACAVGKPTKAFDTATTMRSSVGSSALSYRMVTPRTSSPLICPRT